MSKTILDDAIKTKCSYRGQALLQWDFTGHSGSARQSTQMPEDVIDKILAWRDLEQTCRKYWNERDALIQMERKMVHSFEQNYEDKGAK